MKSSSGGAFTELASLWAEQNGVVIGAAFTEDHHYVHHIACSGEDFSALRKSKYVFSDPEKTYTECRKYLENGKKVVFCGTPCQIGGLVRFLGRHYDNLLTIDFICHGTPSIDILNAHLDWISSGKSVTNVDFRSKAFGWRLHCLKVETESKDYLKNIYDDFYMYSFMRYSMLRECCYKCQYSDGNHVSDITIADFWGIKKMDPKYKEDKGVSLIIFNNSAHMDLVKKLHDTMILSDVQEKDYKYVYKTHLHYDIEERKKFFEEYHRSGWAYMAKKYYKGRTKRKIIRILKKISGAKS